jgi:hypothetical protein
MTHYLISRPTAHPRKRAAAAFSALALAAVAAGMAAVPARAAAVSTATLVVDAKAGCPRS